MQVVHHPVGHIRECPSTPPRLLYAESKKNPSYLGNCCGVVVNNYVFVVVIELHQLCSWMLCLV